MTVLRELLKYKLDLVGVQRSDGRAVAPNLWENTHFSMERRNENHELSTGFFVHISAVKRIEFVSDRMSYIILRGRWCHHCSERSCSNRR
jgi:hypothetical protein